VPSPDEVKGLQHQPVDESQPQRVIPIRALLGSDTGATKVFLFFRSAGQEDFLSTQLKRTQGAEFAGVIPGEAVVGRALQYYLEARDSRGRAMVGSGSALNPYIVSISANAAPPGNVPEVDVEDPLLAERLRKQHLDDDKKKSKLHRFFFFIMPGFGFGYEPAGNVTEVAWQLQPGTPGKYVRQNVGAGGVAIAPFHLALEIGGMVTKNFSISAMARFQLVTGANAETQDFLNAQFPATGKATGAISGFLRFRYRFLDGIFHPYVALTIGGGQIRHSLDVTIAGGDALVDRGTAEDFNTPGGASITNPALRQAVCPAMGSCIDSISLGYFFIGGGGGVWVDVWKYIGVIFDINLLGAIGTGEGQSGMNIDLNIGVGAHF